MNEDQELIGLRELKQVVQDAFVDAQGTFLDAQHTYVDASQAVEKSAELSALSQAASSAAVRYLAALETLRNTQLQAEPLPERDAEDMQLEKLRETLEKQMETFRQILAQHDSKDRPIAGQGSE